MAAANKRIDGDNILYHYFDKKIFDKENQFAMELLEHLLVDLSIWLPLNFFRRLPIVLPYVIRDPSCRRRKKAEMEEWGSANERGFLRDDNSLIKGIVNSFTIKSIKIESYNGQKKGRGFVASHIWRIIRIRNNELISSRHHMLNSFVPNIVWLPRQIAKLTDREGSPAQRMLQAISHKIYDSINMPEEISGLWNYLTFPEEYKTPEINTDDLSFFVVDEKWLNRRIKGLISEMDRIISIKETYDPKMKRIKCSRYCPSLAKIPLNKRQLLTEWLIRYKRILTRLAAKSNPMYEWNVNEI
ncbi:MAG: hypothetical protein GTN76_03880 [Candidatus Aenigmarchaeota archaeon]|nr:hypothetical protein [Candidatus Aenigmarchaeota archaeon]